MSCNICHTGEFLATVCSPCFNEEKARAEKVERERDEAQQKIAHLIAWGDAAEKQRETAEARVKKLMKYIRVAPHGGMCASIEHLNSYYADHPRPLCDCWKAAALAQIEEVRK